jgi:hypothetical protein
MCSDASYFILLTVQFLPEHIPTMLLYYIYNIYYILPQICKYIYGESESAFSQLNNQSRQHPRTKLCAHGLQQELPHKFNFVKCEGLMVLTLKTAIFWDVTPCNCSEDIIVNYYVTIVL